MDLNTAAIRALRDYVRIREPGYAFMIEAPWGAGKTFFVMREFGKNFSSDKARYITLNGVSDPIAFRRALLAQTSDAKLRNAVKEFGNVVGRFSKVGNVGSLVQNAVEERMIRNLPDLLVFDDVERCQIPAAELLGLINEFVEHQKKNVVLCAFAEREDNIEGKKALEDFLSRKEKVVGRTVRVVANAHSAFPDFVKAMPESLGKTFLGSQEDDIIRVFSDAKHSNLRILRQCLHDCGRVIDVFDEDLRGSTDAVSRFTRTYLALSMALANAEIQSSHLNDRGDYQRIARHSENSDPHPLLKIRERHKYAEVYAGNAASILPVELGCSLIGIGYEEPEKINGLLRATGQFLGHNEVPLWRRFVKWRDMSRDDLDRTYAEAKHYVFENEAIEAGPFLHVAHDLVSIAKDGFGNGEQTAFDIKERIRHLAVRDKIPPAAYGSGFGWGDHSDMFSFGGYSYEPDEIMRSIIEEMKSAQIGAFEKTVSEEGRRLLDLFRENLDAFGCEFSWNSGHAGYQRRSILQEINAAQFSEAVFCHIEAGASNVVGTHLLALAERHKSQSMPEELSWTKDVEANLRDLAEKAGPLEKARMRWFLGHYWRFPLEERTAQ